MTTLLSSLPLLALWIGACAPTPPPASTAAAADTVEIPFTLVHNRVHVPVAVNGQGPFDFMLDMGASGVGRLDDSLRASLGVAVVGQVDNFDGVNTAPIDIVSVERLALGPLIRQDVRLLSRDYSMQGILGQRYFEEYLLTIDYPGQVLRIAEGSLDAASPHVTAYVRHFQVPVRIGLVETVATLDTGSSLTMLLPMAYADSLETTELVEAGRARRANTEFSLYRATLLEPIVLAGHTITGVEVRFTEQARRINIGSALLSRFAITFDQKNQRIRIAPPTENR